MRERYQNGCWRSKGGPVLIITYDPSLVALSILIAVSGGYTCFHLMDRLTRLYGTAWKMTLLTASVAIGGGIWAMHFVGMLALHLPVTIGYDLQQTLLSASIAIGVTAVALYLVTLRKVTKTLTTLSGLLMGCGISGMHYVGMEAIRGNCIVMYSPSLVTFSVVVGIGASMMALYLSLRVRNKLKQVPAAVAMGLGIAGMHYSGMYAASFAESGDTIMIAAPVLSDASMAVVITVVAFLLLGSTFFLAAPVPDLPRREESAHAPPPHVAVMTQPTTGEENTPSERPTVRIPVQSGNRRTRLEPKEIACVHADAHYTKVCTGAEEFFCNLSISDIEKVLHPFGFLRVHRSHLVNVKSITVFSQQKDHGEITLVAAGSEQSVPVSRGKLELLKASLATNESA